MVAAELSRQLQKVIRRGRVLTAPAQLAGYDTDGLGYKLFRPDAVVLPADADELIQLLRASKSLGVPVTIRGAGTSLSGGPVAAQGGVVVHTSALKKVVQICREGYWCEVECSVVLNQLDAALAPHGLFYPPDPSSGPVCTLGGNVAMNAGGAHCFRYGVTSNYVLGMEAVMLDGTVQRFGGPAGGRGAWKEDWKRLMVGSEGTLAAFSRFWLRLLPRPEKCWTYRATYADLGSAERAVHALAVHASFPVAIELMDPRCVAMVENSPMRVGLPKDSFLIVTEIDGPAELVDARAAAVAEVLRSAGATSVEYSDNEEARRGLWKARKVAGGLMGQLSPDFLVQDAVIPKRALAEVLQLVYDEADAAGLRAVNVFHAGDGNLHPNFLFDSRKPGEIEKVEAISKRLMQRVVDVGGTLSGEHGIGNDKTAYMPMIFGEQTLKLQLAVPRVFNPDHQLNPLKVFASRRFGPGASGTATDSGISAAGRNVDDVAHHYGTVLAESKAGASATTHVRDAAFAPFFDEIDGTLCGSAALTAAELRATVGAAAFRFPLLLDEQATLWEQVRASGYASASSRFGSYCDNISGMNWRFPDGRILRIGERVVKSTTGYDLFRFLLNSNGRFGEPTDFVLRLRPDCGQSGVFWLSGRLDSVRLAAQQLTGTCWIHWFDSMDVLLQPGTQQAELRISLNCPPEEWEVYLKTVDAISREHRLALTSEPQRGLEPDGLPDVMLKTTPDRAIELGQRVGQRYGMRVVVIAGYGVVHGYVDSETQDSVRQRVQACVTELSGELAGHGGDWQSRHLSRGAASGVEAGWLEVLDEAWGSSE